VAIMSKALVLAGGGVAGIAWEIGVLRGLADEKPGLAGRLTAADVVIGTSAGSSVAAQITSDTPLDQLYEAQLAPESAEIDVELDMEALMAQWAAAALNPDGTMPEPAELRRRVAAMALAAATVPEEDRRRVIAARLPSANWPGHRLLITAVDAATGELTVFDRGSGVDLVDAVAASCAVPGVWPPVTIGERRYVDGGIRSTTNADLAAGADHVLVITPALPGAAAPLNSIEAEIEALRPAESMVVWADQASIDAFGPNPLSPASRAPAARAGREVGRAQAGVVAAFWG
jgi:NTE family protein